MLDPYWTLGCGGFPWLQKDSLEVVKDKQRRPARPVFKNPKTGAQRDPLQRQGGIALLHAPSANEWRSEM